MDELRLIKLAELARRIDAAPDLQTGSVDIAAGLAWIEQLSHQLGSADLRVRPHYVEAELRAGAARQSLATAPGRLRCTAPDNAAAATSFEPDAGTPGDAEPAQPGALHRHAALLAAVIYRRLAAAVREPMTADELLAFTDLLMAAEDIHELLGPADGDIR